MYLFSILCIVFILAIIIMYPERREYFTVVPRASLTENDKPINSMDFAADYPLSDSYTNHALPLGAGGGTVGRYPAIPSASGGLGNEIVGHTDLSAPIPVRARSIRGPRVLKQL